MDNNDQMEIKFPKKFKPKEMGIVFPKECGKGIRLNSSFAIEELGIGGFGNIDNFCLGKETEVFCPFCLKGHLRIKKVEPIYSKGVSRFGASHHVGNDYEFDCSVDCGAIFSCQIQWMCID